MKICNKCKIEKSLDEYRNDRRGKSGKESRCKRCRNDDKNLKYSSDHELRKRKRAQNKVWREANKEYVKQQNAKWVEENKEYYLAYHKENRLSRKELDKEMHRGNRIKKYWPGSTWQEALVRYDFLIKSQKDRCAICDKHQSEFKKSLAVDHNHKTGLVRGALCYRCNRLHVSIHTTKSAKAVYEYLLKSDGE